MVDWGIVCLLEAQMWVHSPLRGVWAGCYFVPRYYGQCQSATTSTVVKALLVPAALVKQHYTKYLGFIMWSRDSPEAKAVC